MWVKKVRKNKENAKNGSEPLHGSNRRFSPIYLNSATQNLEALCG